MKQYYLIFAVCLTVLATGCTKNNIQDTVKEPFVVTASFAPSTEVPTKTTFDISDLSLKWAENDKILLVSDETKTLWETRSELFLTSGDGTTTASFSYTGEVNWTGVKRFLAFYPGTTEELAGKRTNWERINAYSTHTYFIAKLPQTQSYKADGPYPELLAMRAPWTASSQNLHFENFFSILRLPVYCTSSTTLSSITITSGENKALTGQFFRDYRYNQESGTVSKEYGNVTGRVGYTHNSVILTDISEVVLSTNPAAPTYFYFVVNAGNHGNLSLQITNGDGNKTWTLRDEASIARGYMYTLPTVNWSAKAVD